MYRPFAVIGITFFVTLFAIGITGEKAAIFLLVISALAASLFVIFGRSKTGLLCMASFAVLAACFLFTLKTECSYKPALLKAGNNVFVEGTVVKNLKKNDYGVSRYVIDSNGTKIRLSSNNIPDAEYGDIVSFSGTLYELGSDDDSVLYYKSQSLYLGAYTSGEIKLNKCESHSLYYYILKLKDKLALSVNSVLTKQEGAVLTAMLLGDKSYMNENTKSVFKGAGVMHIFAVSGLHLSIWTTVLYSFLKSLKIKRKLRSIILIVFTVFFAALTGFSQSVLRAGIVTLCAFSADLFTRKADSLNSLGLAVLLICVADPFAATDCSLLLSFFSVLAILTLCKNEPKHFKGIYMSFCTLAATVPIMIMYFDEFSVLSPISNLCILWCSAPVILFTGLGAVLSLSGLLGFLKYPLLFISGMLAKFMIFICGMISKIPGARISVDNDIFIILVCFVMIIAAACISKLKADKKRIVIFVLLSVIVCESGMLSYSMMNMDVLSIKIPAGGNSSFIILEKNGRNAVIACGGEYDTYSKAESLLGDEIDLLVVPRDKETENLYYPELIFDYVPLMLCVPSAFETTALKKSTEVVRADTYNVTIWDNVTIEYRGDKEPVKLTCDGFSMVFSFYPGVSSLPDKLSHADILYARSKAGDVFKSECFGDIIIGNDKLLNTGGNFILTEPYGIEINIKNGKYLIGRMKS